MKVMKLGGRRYHRLTRLLSTSSHTLICIYN